MLIAVMGIYADRSEGYVFPLLVLFPSLVIAVAVGASALRAAVATSKRFVCASALLMWSRVRTHA